VKFSNVAKTAQAVRNICKTFEIQVVIARHKTSSKSFLLMIKYLKKNSNLSLITRQKITSISNLLTNRSKKVLMLTKKLLHLHVIGKV